MATLHRGTIATNPQIIEIRPLTRDDLACLRDKRPPQGIAKSFRDWHHKIARAVAMGLRPSEICQRIGISNTRLGQLRNDPAFVELVAQYRNKVDEGFIDAATELYETVAANTINAETLIRDRLESVLDGDADIDLKTLLSISRDGADRIGLPKQKLTQNTNLNLDFATLLEKAAARSGRSNIIDAVPAASQVSRSASGPKTFQPMSLSSAHPQPPAVVAGIRRRA